jgi:hypothetical protein
MLEIEEEKLLKSIQYILQQMADLAEPNKREIVREGDDIVQYKNAYFSGRREITRTHKDVIIKQFLECEY